MNKEWYKSKTVWGGILIALEAGLKALPGEWTYVEPVISALGVFLTVYGFRSALK